MHSTIQKYPILKPQDLTSLNIVRTMYKTDHTQLLESELTITHIIKLRNSTKITKDIIRLGLISFLVRVHVLTVVLKVSSDYA